MGGGGGRKLVCIDWVYRFWSVQVLKSVLIDRIGRMGRIDRMGRMSRMGRICRLYRMDRISIVRGIVEKFVLIP